MKLEFDADNLNAGIDSILGDYKKSFSEKVYVEENNEYDVLMNVFGITPDLKRENRQYWGRELGLCWQRIVVEVCKSTRDDYEPGVKINLDEPCDLVVGNLAIDTKYRIGSGDSGTLKKFKSYGATLKGMNLEPVFLIVRDDNLGAAISACLSGGWDVKIGQSAFDYLRELTGVDVKSILQQRAGAFAVAR